MVQKNMNDFLSTNSHLQKLPDHLLQYIVDQDYSKYTSVDQAVWRYVMKKNLDYLPKVIFGNYINGLKQAGITIEKIPDLYGMNRILQDVGWAAVCVDGFIPPQAFMEFQSHKVLVIAADIRQLKHLEYTPAPDILHEAAGHAPIIPDKKYSKYLQLFGEIGTNAFSSSTDLNLFEAIRTLSILKEAPGASKLDIEKAQNEVEFIQKKARTEELSEMSKIRNLHWWTVEYGLIGTLDNPKIYGAGLLSSIGESEWCMSEAVKKEPYNINACIVNFDITKPQPQLFVTPDFDYLINVLEEFASKMAYKNGGFSGVKKAIFSGEVSTFQYENGVQVSGVLSECINENNELIYVRTNGPTAISYLNSELFNHGTSKHSEGFGAPLGKIVNYSVKNIKTQNLSSLGLSKGTKIIFKYDTGLTLEGILIDYVTNDNQILIFSFANCEIKYKNQILFKKSWGNYDLILGERIVSCFPRPADTNSFSQKKYTYQSETIKVHYSQIEKKYHVLYQEVRGIREGKMNLNRLREIFKELEAIRSEEWLIILEIAQLAKNLDNKLFIESQDYLVKLSDQKKDIKKLILDGLNIL